MKVTLIRNNMTFSNAWQTLADIPFHALGDKSLQEIQNGSEEAVFILDEELLNASLIDGIKWSDILDPNTKADGSVKRVVFCLVKESDFVWYLTADGNRVVKLDATQDVTDEELTRQILGNKPSVYYSIAAEFFQCTMRMRDYFESIVETILGKDWKGRKETDKYLNALNHYLNANFDTKKRTPEKNSWMEYARNSYTKDYNIEFSNFQLFICCKSTDFDKLGGSNNNGKSSTFLQNKCRELKDYRNNTAHNVESLVGKGKDIIELAITNMIAIAGTLGNKELKKELENKKKIVGEMFDLKEKYNL